MARWIALIGLIAAFLLTQHLFDESRGNREPLSTRIPAEKPPVYGATRIPGRILVLHTNKGKIDIVLFEKDCFKTTRRIADMVACGAYDGVTMPRVEDDLIQSEEANARVSGVLVELANELRHVPGAVGLARAQPYDSCGSSFYIMKRPVSEFDGEYTVFGHVIRGFDVVKQIEANDIIRSARLRNHNAEDLALLNEAKLTAIKRTPRPLEPEFAPEPKEDHEHSEGSGCCPGH